MMETIKTLALSALLLGWAAFPATAEPWTLQAALSHALTNNPDARLAKQRIALAQAELGQANAAFSPRLQFASSYIRTDNPMQVFGSILNQRSYSTTLDFNDVPDTDNLNTRGLLTVPLYAGGRNVAARQAAQASTEAAKREAEAVRNSLGFEVARAFHTVEKTREFIKATQAGVRDFETNAAFASKRFRAGTLLKTDLLDVDVRLAQAREDYVRARNAHALALHALRNLLGIEDPNFTIAESTNANPHRVSDTGDFSARPELAASQYRQRAAEAAVRQASSGYKPRVSAFGSLDYDYGPRTGGDGASYTGGVLLQWDLWDGGLTRSKKEQAKANVQITHEEDRKLRFALDLELEQARLALREAQERLAVTYKVVEQAQESVSLTRVRFDQGIASTTQLIDAETALITARVRRAEAESDQRIALAALRKALALPQIEVSTTK